MTENLPSEKKSRKNPVHTGTNIFSGTTVTLLCCIFAVSVVLPLVSLLANLGKADIGALISDTGIKKAALNSLTVSLTASLISISVAFTAALCMSRTAVKFKPFFNICVLLPMLIPSISHGMGLIILLGSNGILTRVFHLSKGIYGFWGIVAGSVLYAFPVAYIMISDTLKYEDSTPYEAAAVLGIPWMRRFTAITAPYLKKPMLNVFFAVFTMIVTDYGVPLMVGGMYKTLPVMMYEEVIGRQNFAKGSFFGLILLIPAAAAFAVDIICAESRKCENVSRPFTLEKKPARDGAAFAFLSVISVFAVFPILAFTATAFANRYPSDLTPALHNISNTFRKGAGGYLVNSITVALATAAAGTFTAFISACFTARKPNAASKLLHLLSVLSLAVPGIVLGLSYVLFFSGSFIYGTIAILILANTVHFFSSPYLMIYNSIGKLNPNLETAAATLGIGKFHLIKDIILPQTKTTLAEMFSYFFVNSMMTISAVAFLANVKTKPISLMIPQFEQQMLIESSAFVSLLILVVNLAMKTIVYLIKKRYFKINKAAEPQH